MNNGFKSTIAAIGISLALAAPLLAQAGDESSPQTETTNNTVFLPFVAGGDSQSTSPDADAAFSETALLAENGADVQASAVIATNGKIVFSSIANNGDADIYTMNSDGTGVVNLTSTFAGPNHELNPKWSPDGSKILFVSRPFVASGGGLSVAMISDPNTVYFGRIAVMNADGTNPIFLTTTATNDAQPEWSPDGTKIAFTTVRENDYDIYVMNADGSNPHNLLVSEPAASSEYYPAWSPDGTKLLYIVVSGFDLIRHVATIDAAGLGPQALLTSDYMDVSYSPQWSPDGRLIVYNGRSPAATILNTIKIINADGSNSSTWTVSNLLDITAPDFSPDGKLITLVGQPAGVTNGSRDLYSLPAPVAPLGASANVTANATRITTLGGVVSADWQRTLITTYPLSVTVAGLGVVTSVPTGINCSTKCSAEFVAGTRVTLTATPGAKSRFSSWSGACTTTSTTCTVTMSQARSVTANFKKR